MPGFAGQESRVQVGRRPGRLVNEINQVPKPRLT